MTASDLDRMRTLEKKRQSLNADDYTMADDREFDALLDLHTDALLAAADALAKVQEWAMNSKLADEEAENNGYASAQEDVIALLTPAPSGAGR